MAHVNMHTADRPGRLENWRDVPLTIALIDQGGPLTAEIWAGSRPVIAFRTDTHDVEQALDVASDVLASALRPLLHAAASAYDVVELPGVAGD